jgi:hypothetical protein
VAIAAALWPLAAGAAPWTFGEPVTVSPPRDGVFHHLESAGRRSLAVSGGVAAVVWEDNGTGAPQAYVALKGSEAAAFGAGQRLSTGAEAYEPAVAPLADGAFLAAWEQDGAVWARRVGRGGEMGEARRVGGQPSRQITVAGAGGDTALLAWAEGDERTGRVQVARWADGGVGAAAVADATGPGGQLYPALVGIGDGAVVAWEDRRRGHTVIMYARSADLVRFSPAAILNDLPPSMSAEFGSGTGAARVVMCADDAGVLTAVWADKRDFLSGYDVYAALGPAPGADFAAGDERVQDDFGAGISQWHPAVACGPDGMRVAAWDDDRDETPDIWISWRGASGWSEDLAVPGAAGPGAQGYPAVTVDRAGRLHVAWVEQGPDDDRTRIRYAVARPVAK